MSRVRVRAAVLATLIVSSTTVASPATRPPAPQAFGDSLSILTLPYYLNDVRTVVLDAAAGYGYLGVNTIYANQPAAMAQIRLADLVWITDLGSPTGDFRSAVIDVTQPTHYIYFGTGGGKVLKAAQGFSELALGPGETYLYAAVVDQAAGFAYFAASTQPASVVKVRLSDFTRVGALTLDPGEDFIRSAVVDAAGGFAYFGTNTQPGKVVKVRLSDFTRVGALTLDPGESQLTSAAIDPAGGFAYFGTFTSPGRVVKVRLSDFTRVGALTLNAGEGYLSSAALDPDGGYAAFGTLTSPGIVVRVHLADLTHGGAIMLPAGVNDLKSASFDPLSRLAYFGAGTSPGKVVRLDLSDRISTTTSIVSSINPSLVGQQVTLTATVSPVSGGGTPTGTVQWFRTPYLESLGSSNLVAGVASLTTSSFFTGPNLIKAYYGGDGTFSPGSGSLTQVTVTQSYVDVASLLNPSRVGEEVTFTAFAYYLYFSHGFYLKYPVSGGTVQFKADGVDLGLPVAAGGVARFATSSLTAGTHTITAEYSPGATDYYSSSTGTLPDGQVVVGTPPLGFYTLAPCRVVDTRDANGPLGGPALQPTEDRAFPLAGACEIPPGARVLSLNVTVTGPTESGYLTVHPTDASVPLASTMNFEPGLTRANNSSALVKGDGSGSVSIFNGSTGKVHVIVDVNGYFQ